MIHANLLKYLRSYHRHAFLSEFALFLVSTVVLQISRFGVNLTAAKWLGPDSFGAWNGLAVLLTYVPILTLGVINGMNREVPLLTGKGESAATLEVARTSLTMSLSSGVLGALLIAGYGAIQLNAAGIAFMLFSGLLLAQQLYVYLQVWLKSSFRFRQMSMQQLVFAVSFPVIVLPLTALWQLNGFILGQMFAVVFIGIWIVLTVKAPFSLGFDVRIFRQLSRVGLPIMLAGILYGLMTTLDRWVILGLLDVRSLGYYTVAIMMSSIIGLVPLVLGQQMYPRMAYQYGRTGDVRSLRPLVFRQIVPSLAATVSLVLLFYILLPRLVSTFLPEYTPGLVPAQILLLGLVFLPIGGGFGNLLNTVGKQDYYLVIQVIGVILNVTFQVVLVKAGFGLVGVAAGAALALACYSLGLVGAGVMVMHSAQNVSRQL